MFKGPPASLIKNDNQNLAGQNPNGKRHDTTWTVEQQAVRMHAVDTAMPDR